MKPLRVCDALQVVAGSCSALAGEVHAGAPPPLGQSSQPSSAAMSLSHNGVEAAAATMVARMQATGAKLSAARINYDDNEAQSAVKLRAAGEPVV